VTTKTQLAKIEKRLTAQQAVLAYLADIVRRFDSFDSWVEEAVGTKGQAPLTRASEAAREAVHNAMKGQSRDAVAIAERDAIRDAIFLMCLFQDVSGNLLDKAVAYSLQASLCAREMQLLLLQQMFGEDTRGVRDFLMAKSVVTPKHGEAAAELIDRFGAYVSDGIRDGLHGGRDKRPTAGQAPTATGRAGVALSRDRIMEVRQRIEDHLARAYLHRATIAVIRRNYFADRPILFRREANRLEAIIHTAEAIAEEYNGFVRALDSHSREGLRRPTARGGSSLQGDLGIDVGAAERRANSQVRDEVAFMVQMAKAQALVKLGREEQARDLAIETWRNR